MAKKITVCFSKKLEASLRNEKMSGGLEKISRLLVSIEMLWLGRSAFRYWPNDAMGYYFDLKSQDSTKLLSQLRQASRVAINLALERDEQTLRYEYISATIQFHGQGKSRVENPEIVFLIRGNDGALVSFFWQNNSNKPG